jgi:hypothetical protein
MIIMHGLEGDAGRSAGHFRRPGQEGSPIGDFLCKFRGPRHRSAVAMNDRLPPPDRARRWSQVISGCLGVSFGDGLAYVPLPELKPLFRVRCFCPWKFARERPTCEEARIPAIPIFVESFVIVHPFIV